MLTILYSDKMRNPSLRDHVALITGANHGIGAATAKALAAREAAVVVSYLRIPDPGGLGGPELYRTARAQGAEKVLAAIKELGGRAISMEADLADAGTAARLFDTAEAAFGPVDILINNATGWVPDTFSPTPQQRFGHQQVRVSAETIDHQFAVDARSSALLIADGLLPEVLDGRRCESEAHRAFTEGGLSG